MTKHPSVITTIILFTLALCLGSLHAEPSKAAGKKEPVIELRRIKVRPPSTIYDGCDLLNNRGEHTIIPKNSILYTPEKHKKRISNKASGKFLLWPSFLKRNANWVWTYEISRAQAKGLAPLPKARMEEFAKLGRVVVATNNRNPIAVFPQKKQTATQEKDTKKSK
jgi:hypothetical protein